MSRRPLRVGSAALLVFASACPKSGSAPAVPITASAALTAVQITASDGDLRLSASGDGSTAGAVTLGSGRRAPTFEQAVQDGVLVLTSSCPHSSCDALLELALDPALPVTVSLGEGDLSLDGLAGDLNIASGSGSIRGTGLRSPTVRIEGGFGDMQLAFVDGLVELDITSASGTIDVTLPAGGYAVDVQALLGTVDTGGVVSDSGADAVVRISSGNGNVVLRRAE